MSNKIVISIVIVLIVLGVSFSFFKKSASNNDLNSGSKVSNTDLNVEKQNTQNADVKLVDNQDKKVMQATIETNKGNIEVEFGTATPKTVENFTKLAKEGYYDGIKFHRVIKGFMIQAGDPQTKDDSKMALWGTGGPGYKFDDELTGKEQYPQGTLAMANAGPNTNGSQFFIVTATPGAPLPPSYTVFGKVTKGMDTALAIENVKTGQADRPIDAVVIKSITVK